MELHGSKSNHDQEKNQQPNVKGNKEHLFMRQKTLHKNKTKRHIESQQSFITYKFTTQIHDIDGFLVLNL